MQATCFGIALLLNWFKNQFPETMLSLKILKIHKLLIHIGNIKIYKLLIHIGNI